MVAEILALAATTGPILAFLLWRGHVDRRAHEARLVRADVHQAATRVLSGETLLAITVASPTALRRGQVRLSTPIGYESLIAGAMHSVLERTPSSYDIVIQCGVGS